MATRFEIVFSRRQPGNVCARRGKKRLDEIERLEAQLSLFKPTSEIARLNARAAPTTGASDPCRFPAAGTCTTVDCADRTGLLM